MLIAPKERPFGRKVVTTVDANIRLVSGEKAPNSPREVGTEIVEHTTDKKEPYVDRRHAEPADKATEGDPEEVCRTEDDLDHTELDFPKLPRMVLDEHHTVALAGLGATNDSRKSRLHYYN